MNSWRSRLALGLLFGLSIAGHAALMRFNPHGDWGMLLYYASAAFFDLILLRTCPRITGGQLCDDMMALCGLSMFGNAFGWALYMLYVPPVYYYGYMWAITGVQAIRLTITDDDAHNPIRGNLLRRHPAGRAREILETEKQ